MLNFLLDRSPSSTKKTTRQTTLDTMFSHLKSRSPPKKSSSPPSLTTGSSVTDHSSETSDDHIHSSTYSKTSLSVTNTSLTTFTTIQKSKSAMGQEASKQEVEMHEQEIRNSIDRELDTSVQPDASHITIHSTSSDATPPSTPESDSQDSTSEPSSVRSTPEATLADAMPKIETPPRTPVRTKVVQQPGSVTRSSASKALGKRRRDDTESNAGSQSEPPRPRKSPRRSIRSTKLIDDSTEKQAKDNTKLASKSAPKRKSSTTAVSTNGKLRKLYIEFGLYAGQVANFDARLTTAQNESKKKATNVKQDKPKERQYLPMPMFSGRRLLSEGRDFKLPYDVFSPLNGRQAQPEKWSRLQKNTYIGDAVRASKIQKHQEESRCVCTQDDGCGDGCLNRELHLECDDTNCRIGPEFCKNRSFADLKARLANSAAIGKALATYLTGVEVCQTPGRGFGLRACRSFNEDQIIVEYTGEIITKDEASRRLSQEYKDQAHHYMMEFHGGYILDGTRGSIARFVNHSCSPNCGIKKTTVHGKNRMALFAERAILPGEELTYDYNFEPFNEESKQTCNCGSQNCRGFLVPKPKETKEARDPKDALQPITNRKRKLGDTIAAITDMVMPNNKRRKNIPKSVKGKPANASAGVSTEKGSAKAKPVEKEYVLPKGWAYRPGPKPEKKVFEEDPEEIMKALKRAKKEAQSKKTAQADRDGDIEMEDASSPARQTSNDTITAKAAATTKRIANTVKKTAKTVTGTLKN